MTSMRATGPFEVVLQPLAIDAAREGVGFGRLSDSGTDELVGLSGQMSIVIESGKHAYVFEYALG
jgi:uncharacterized protein DUF3224